MALVNDMLSLYPEGRCLKELWRGEQIDFYQKILHHEKWFFHKKKMKKEKKTIEEAFATCYEVDGDHVQGWF